MRIYRHNIRNAYLWFRLKHVGGREGKIRVKKSQHRKQ